MTPLDAVRIIAHRGASIRLPENTMAAFNGAMEAGAHMIELDVRLSADGAVVVIHDDTLDRTTRGTGPVAARTASELKRLGVPLLEDVLMLPIALNVEIKAPEAATPVVELVRDLNGIVISCFSLPVLAQVRALNPSQPVGYLSTSDNRREVLDAALAAGAFSYNLPRTVLSPRLVEEAHAGGLKAMAFTINSADEAERAFIWGVDAIFTDDPAGMLAIL
ncbi:MAG TPA: glycerophosphodiester phosphodiesterase family protein [Chloroflexota bacterium]|nr:glycerophosphodiester phosphodiesterase family protein [Chloroflexota bacterium]